jgi:DNA end-binding protein Ku
MASRAFWKGYLKLSLVTCAVAMVPARSDSEKLRFHTVNRKTGNRVESRYVDAETGKAVPEQDQVKGYEKGDNDYVMLEDEELDAVALESTRTIDIEMFSPAASIGWIWYDRPHFLTPDDKVGVEAFCVIREAMRATGMVGLSRVVLYRRERRVMLQPHDSGLILWTLRYGDEVRDPAAYFTGLQPGRADAKALSLVAKVIDERTKPWSPAMVSDPVQDRLKEIVASKEKGKRPIKAKREPERASNVIDIMDALRKSLGTQKPRSAK